MDGQTDVGHINLIGGLVTRNPPKNEIMRRQGTAHFKPGEDPGVFF